jgi:hypothetical protein
MLFSLINFILTVNMTSRSLNVLNDNNNDSLQHDFFQSRKKRSFSVALGESNDEPINSQNLIIHMDDSTINTTNHIETNFMIMYFANGLYYCCYYESLAFLLQFIEPIQVTNDDIDVIKTILEQFKPEVLICNSKIEMQLKLTSEFVDSDLKINIKTSKEFSRAEGECFIDSLQRELNRRKDSSKVRELKDFISRLNEFEDYNYYVCKTSYNCFLVFF